MEIIIKMDREEPVKVKAFSIYGELHPEDEPHPINEVIQNLNAQIQDLKLENDRLKQREEIMLHFIKSVHCKEMVCEYCDLHYYGPKGQDFCAQVKHDKLESIADDVLKKLEDL